MKCKNNVLSLPQKKKKEQVVHEQGVIGLVGIS